MDILQELTPIFKDVFGKEDLAITRETTSDDIAGWDSLGHIELVDAIEKHFKLKFSAREIRSWHKIGDLCDSISVKIPR
jgi:acyl carrier protein